MPCHVACFSCILQRQKASLLSCSNLLQDCCFCCIEAWSCMHTERCCCRVHKTKRQESGPACALECCRAVVLFTIGFWTCTYTSKIHRLLLAPECVLMHSAKTMKEFAVCRNVQFGDTDRLAGQLLPLTIPLCLSGQRDFSSHQPFVTY